jgi:hypothetical protein
MYIYNTNINDDLYISSLYSLYKEYKEEIYKGEKLFILQSISKNILYSFTGRDYNNSIKLYKELNINEEVLRLLKYKNTRIILFNSWEVINLHNNNIDKNISIFSKIYNIEKSKIYISISDINSIYSDSNKNNRLPYDWVYIRSIYNYKKTKRSKLNINKKKHLISLNRRNNEERFAFSVYLYNYFKDKIYLSYLDKNEKGTNEWLKYHVSFKDVSDIKLGLNINEYNIFNNNLPLVLDNTIRRVHWETYNTIDKYLDDSYIMLVFETNIMSITNKCIQISEKTYKPILYGIPFIVWCNKPGILLYLKKMNFKTFAPYINEEYDNINYDYHTRIKLLKKEITRILNMSIENLREIYLKLIPIIKHNWKILEEGKIKNLMN